MLTTGSTDAGTTACAVTGCRAFRHTHRYAQDSTGCWSCGGGAWTPKPPPPAEQATDLSAYNVVRSPAGTAHDAQTREVTVRATDSTPQRIDMCVEVFSLDVWDRSEQEVAI